MDSSYSHRPASSRTSTSRRRGGARHEAPFEQLPNLPKPVIPKIDLDIQRMDITGMLHYKPSLALHRKIGYSIQDQHTQTEDTEIVDVHEGIEALQMLAQDAGKLRRDLNFAKHILRTNYEQQIKDRSTELYCRVNEKINEMERQNKTKMGQIRQSYQMQLDNAIHRISGEYKAYYDDMLEGKTGHHDATIEELKKQISEKDLLIRQQEVQIESYQEQIKFLESNNNRLASASPPPAGISQEEAESLYEQLEHLQSQLNSAKTDLATQEDENKQLKRQIDRFNKQLEDQKMKYKQLEKDTENYKMKTKAEQEKASRMAENRLAAMEREMKEKMESATKEATLKAQEQAEMQRMKDQAKFQEEAERSKKREEELLLQAQQKPSLVGDSELLRQIESLQKLEAQHKQEISRLKKELDRVNKIWELKMAVMKKNFHALKNELHLRHTLERQSIHLHHATIGYASSGNHSTREPDNPSETKSILTKLKTVDTSSHSRGKSSQGSPQPIELTTQSLTGQKNVHFDDTNLGILQSPKSAVQA